MWNKTKVWVKDKWRRFKGIIIGVVATPIVFSAAIVDLDWEYSYTTFRFDTPTGELRKFEWGMTDAGQLFVNDGDSVKEIETPPLEPRYKRVAFVGERHIDVFDLGNEVEVSKAEYKQLEARERIPKLKKSALGMIARGAIANEASNQADSATYVNSMTLSIDCTETDRGVLTFIASRQYAEITGVTHNSDTMTDEVFSTSNNVVGVGIYSRTAADSGTNNVVVSLSDFRLLSMYNICLSGTDQTDMIEDVASTSPAWGTSIKGFATSTTDNAWIMSGVNIQGAYALATGTGETELNDTDHSDANLGQFGVSYVEKVTAGAEELEWSWSTGDNASMALVAVKPAAAAAAVASEGNAIVWFVY